MAIKTFTDSTSLPASDINTFLANSGLVYVTQTTFTNSTSVNIDNVFTATFQHYRVLFRITNASANGTVTMRMRGSGSTNALSNYAFGGFISYSGSAIISSANSGGTTTGFPVTESDTTYYPNLPCVVEVMNPAETYRTTIFSNGFTPVNPQFYYRQMGGAMSVTTAYDGMALVPSSGNISGTITIYGYRLG
jgi:hypothetical protein